MNGGIGTLSEKTIHSTLKFHYAPDEKYHEIPIGSYVADICVDGEITEIQTRQFNVMRDKLNAFLPEHEVTIVHPVARDKWLRYINPLTGEISERKKSPKKGSIYSIMPELYKIKPFLLNPHLHFTVCLLEVEETRFLNPKGPNPKRGTVRNDGTPLQIYSEYSFDLESGYEQFLPPNLPTPFTSADLKSLAHISLDLSVVTLNILTHVGLVRRIGKKGKSYLYECNRIFPNRG